MRKKPSKFPWYLIPVACWLASMFIKTQLGEREAPAPSEPSSSHDSNTVFVDELETALLEYELQEVDDRPYVMPANALAVSLSSKTRIRERDIKNKPVDSPEIKTDKGYFFLDSNKQQFAASKLGLDFKHHFQNSFLVGYTPFEVSEIWMPHEVLNMRLKYQLDVDNFAGFEEIWLTSHEAFQRGRGDCEDHAIALADWLIEMGEDARVVTGTHEGGGHAWVVLIRDKGTFLLEATNKKRNRLFSSYPLARLAKGYAPTAMFNREYYWVKSDQSETSDYTGSHWFKNGKITR